MLEYAEESNNDTYREVISSGLGSLQCLGCEVYGRWSSHSVRLVPALARERSRLLHPRIRRGVALGLEHRWWGILGVALQQAVAHAVLNPDSADLVRVQLELVALLSNLQIL